MILQSFVFLDENSTSATSKNLGNTNGSLLTFEVDSIPSGESVSLVLQGRTNVSETDNWTPLAVVDGKKLAVVENITEKGNYFALLSGISSVRVVSSGAVGSVRVFGKISN